MTCTALCERGAVSLLLLDRLKHRGEQLEGREEDVRTNRVDDQMELSRASVDEELYAFRKRAYLALQVALTDRTSLCVAACKVDIQL